MMYQSMTELIGGTPLVELKKIEHEMNLFGRVAVKLEMRNPAGSAKDRIALGMIRAAEKSGELKSGGTVIEPTSGNTGIGIAAICAALGYHALIVMPNSMSIERMKLIRAYGAELILTNGELGMAGAVAAAETLHKEIPNSIIAGQFSNPANPRSHYETTGPEIWNDTDGETDILVAGIGSGGTITGTGRYLKEKKPSVRVIGIEPAESPLLTAGRAGAHGIQGIGANFVPDALDLTVLDEVQTVTTADSMKTAKLLAKTEGILCGISSGAALYAAIEEAKKEENQGKLIVAILPDTGERYLSSEMFLE